MRYYLYSFTVILLLAFPTLLLNISHFGSVGLGLLALLGIFTAFLTRERLCDSIEKKLIAVLIVFYAVAVFSFLVNSMDRTGLKELELFTKGLLGIPLLYLLLRVNPKQEWLWHGIVGGAMAAGLFGIHEAWMHGLPPAHRVHGTTHWIIYGDISLALAFMSLAAIGFYRRLGKWQTALPFLAFILGLTGSILSATRGAWIAIPALASILFLFYWKNLSSGFRSALVVALFVVPTILYLAPQTGIRERITTATSEVESYYEEGNATGAANSRLEMWRAAWQIFLDNQIIGAGVGKFQEEAAKLVAEGYYNEVIDNWNHPHNEYLNALATRGLLGLMALLALFWVPGKSFYLAMRSDDAELARFGLTGVILIVSYLHFGLTEAILNRSVPLLFFCFYLTLLTYHMATRSVQLEATQE